MKCPTCRAPMTKGDLGLEPTLIGVVTNIATGGVSDLELFFREPNQKRLPIMTPYDTRQAFGCKACRLMVFWTDEKGTNRYRVPGLSNDNPCRREFVPKVWMDV